jgi:phosphoribosylformylglycinamidine cyclo-ligase
VKDNLFPTPPLFSIIQAESATPWREMFRVFNMGHRMELYVDERAAADLIAISTSFGVEARVVGRVESSARAEVAIIKDGEEFTYTA